MRRRTNRSEKVILYRRVSTDEQAESKADLEAQRDRLEMERAHRGWTDAEWIEDEGWSAKTLKRPGITEALRQLGAGEAGVLVVTKLDRLSRSIIDFSELLKRAEREGWAIIALDIDIDMTTATGRMIAKIVAVIAEWERETIGERTTAALQAKRRAGVRLGRPPEISDQTVHDILDMRYKEGLSLQQIVNRLNFYEYETARQRRWWRSTIKAILDGHAREQERLKLRADRHEKPADQEPDGNDHPASSDDDGSTEQDGQTIFTPNVDDLRADRPFR